MRLPIIALLAVSLLAGCPRFQTGSVRYPVKPQERVRIKGRTIHFVDRGAREKPAILFIHGFASALIVWKRLMKDLERDYRVVALSLPGFGYSDKRAGDYSPEGLADLVAGLLAKRGIARAHVVAHSWGSSIALALAQRHPKKVDRLVLMSAFVYDAQISPFQRWSTHKGIGEILFALFYRERVGDRFALGFHDPARYATQSEVRRIETAMQRPGAVRAALEVTRQMRRFKGLERHYPTIRARTLLVWGREDAISSLRFGERLSRELPRARLRVIPRCGHFPMIEGYAITLSALRDHFGGGTR